MLSAVGEGWENSWGSILEAHTLSPEAKSPSEEYIC